MIILFQILLAVIFYGSMWFLYSYSKGNYNVKEEKKELYSKWVEKNGGVMSMGIRMLTIIFSIGLILNLLALV